MKEIVLCRHTQKGSKARNKNKMSSRLRKTLNKFFNILVRYKRS